MSALTVRAPGHRRTRPRRRDAAVASNARRRDGVTIVETMVALMLISIGLYGVVGSSAAVEKGMGGGMRQTVAAGLAQTRLDSLASLSCAQLIDGLAGTTTTRGIREAWRVMDGRNVKSLVVALTVPGRSRDAVYSTIIPCRD